MRAASLLRALVHRRNFEWKRLVICRKVTIFEKASQRLSGKDRIFADMDKWVAGEKRSVPRRPRGSRGTSFGLCPGHPFSQVLRTTPTILIASHIRLHHHPLGSEAD
jgi:hypothetical protein